MPNAHLPVRAVLALALTLVACHPSAPDNRASPAPAPSGDYLARISALNPAQLHMVLFRAIRDAGQDCQDVTRAERLADQSGKALWRITCRGGGQFAVAVGADGVAEVTAPRP